MNQLNITLIRIQANKLVGRCTDTQIIFVAVAGGIINQFVTDTLTPNLEDVPASEINRLALYLHDEVERRSWPSAWR